MGKTVRRASRACLSTALMLAFASRSLREDEEPEPIASVAPVWVPDAGAVKNVNPPEARASN